MGYRPYHLVIHSDHGQTNGATFKQRYGKTLEDLVKELLLVDAPIYADMSPTTGDHFDAVFTVPRDIIRDYFDEKTDDINEYKKNTM